MRYATSLHQIFFPSILYKTHSQNVHLTFDDGPHPVATPQVLKVLKEHNVRATFFLVGQQAREYPELVREIHAGGHTLGNHTFSHKKLFLRSRDFVHEQLLKTEETITDIIGQGTKFFRPPFGSFDYTSIFTAKLLGLRFTLWSFDSRDFEDQPERVARSVITSTKGGSIVLFHDNAETAGTISQTLPRILGGLSDRGLSISPLSL